MATALVTGGTGFLGSHIARVLIEAGHTVRVLRRPNSPLTLVKDLAVEHVIGDVMDTASLLKGMQDCQWVFHVAAVSDYWRANKNRLYLVNVNGTENVLESARQAGVRRIIMTSSAAAVGYRGHRFPADENIPFNFSERHFSYGHSKHLAEQVAWRAVQQGQDIVAVNPSVVLGPGDINQISGSFIVEVAQRKFLPYAAGGITCIDVRDVAQAHLVAAERGRCGERYLLGTADLSYKALYELISEVIGVKNIQLPVPRMVTPIIATGVNLLKSAGLSLPLDADQVRLGALNLYFDCRKSWTELNKPRIDLRQSIQDTYQWYLEQGILETV